jgi:AcrR family transcriptional regulator
MGVMKKDEIYWKVLDAAISLDVHLGHQKWTMTQLSRSSGISRPLIYYYFGREKVRILHEAVSLFGTILASSTNRQIALWNQGQIAESILDTRRRLIMRSPEILVFYFLHRMKDTELGVAIRKKERSFLAKLSVLFPMLTKIQIEGVYALFFGLPFCREISDQAVGGAVEMLIAALNSGTHRTK